MREQATPAATAAGTAVTARIAGLDAARALAVAGMVAVHIGPSGAEAPGTPGTLYSLPHGRASILFIVLAGMGVSLMARGRSRPRTRSARGRLAIRAAILLPLGLALQPLDHGVLVILQYYAAFFVVAALALALADRVLLPLALGWFAAGPLAYLVAWQAWPAWFDRAASTITDPPAVIAHDLVVSGSYPVVTWTAPLLVGMWLGRRDLRRARTRWWMLGGGLLVAAAAWAASTALVAWLGEPLAEPSWAQLVLDDPHSQMPLWLVGSAGSATAAVGGALLVTGRLPRLSWPLVAAGQLALTIYVGHLLVLATWPDLLRRETVDGALGSLALFVLVVCAAAVAWRSAFSRGPLEAALRLPQVLRR